MTRTSGSHLYPPLHPTGFLSVPQLTEPLPSSRTRPEGPSARRRTPTHPHPRPLTQRSPLQGALPDVPPRCQHSTRAVPSPSPAGIPVSFFVDPRATGSLAGWLREGRAHVCPGPGSERRGRLAGFYYHDLHVPCWKEGLGSLPASNRFLGDTATEGATWLTYHGFHFATGCSAQSLKPHVCPSACWHRALGGAGTPPIPPNPPAESGPRTCSSHAVPCSHASLARPHGPTFRLNV